MQIAKNVQVTLRVALAALLLAVALPLAAHEGKTGSMPADGATVHGSPEQVGVEFSGMMRITRFELTGPDGAVELQDRPGREPMQRYHVKPAEPLAPGDYEVEWRGMAGDGHMMSGGFGFRVED